MDRILTNRKIAVTVISLGVVLFVASVGRIVIAQSWLYSCAAGWPTTQPGTCNDSGLASYANPEGAYAEITAGNCPDDASYPTVDAANGLAAPNGCGYTTASFTAAAEQNPFESVEAWATVRLGTGAYGNTDNVFGCYYGRVVTPYSGPPTC
jgi:hypothetical protein